MCWEHFLVENRQGRVPSGEAVEVEGWSESEKRAPAALRRMASSAPLLDQVAVVAAAYSAATARVALLLASRSDSP